MSTYQYSYTPVCVPFCQHTLRKPTSSTACWTGHTHGKWIFSKPFFFLSKRSNRVTLSMSIVAKASPTNSGGREAHTPQYETISGLYNMHLNCPNLGHIDFVLWTHSKFPRIWGQALCTHSPPWARSDHQPRPLCFEPVGVSDWNSSPHPG